MKDHSAAAAEDKALKRSVGLTDLVMLGAGSAIGVSIFTVLGPAAKVAGSGLLIATVLAALPMVIFGFVYAFMASALPKTGASYEWQREFVHPFAGFVVVWLRIVGNVALMVLLARVLVAYLSMVWSGIPTVPVMLGLFTVVFGLNYFGASIAARAQTVLMLLLLAVFALFVGFGAHEFSSAQLEPLFPGWSPILAAIPLLVSLFLGIESNTEIGGEVRNAERNIPLGLVLALGLTALVYLSISVVALGAVGPVKLADSSAPLLTAARHALGTWATPLIVTAAFLSLLKSLNATLLVFTRFLFAMGQAGVLPSGMAKVHPRWKTPHVATTVVFLASVLGTAVSQDILPLLLAVNIPTMLKYFGTCLASLNVIRSRPDVYARARLQFSRTLIVIASVAGMIAAVVLIVLGFETDWRPYALLAVWTVAGVSYWLVRVHRQRPGRIESASASPVGHDAPAEIDRRPETAP
ncbi:APC family permease [Streptomyces sp. LZ34]|uniref:APC family permease n=1 Tax=Streptomyces milbemycinicus TaxID=476552 RepID=UPI0033E7BA9A